VGVLFSVLCICIRTLLTVERILHVEISVTHRFINKLLVSTRTPRHI